MLFSCSEIWAKRMAVKPSLRKACKSRSDSSGVCWARLVICELICRKVLATSATRVACLDVFGPEVAMIPVHACLVIDLRVVAHGGRVAK